MDPHAHCGFAIFQAGLYGKYAVQLNAGSPGIIVNEILDVQAFGFPWLFYLIVMSTMTAGTILLMWIGEQITEKGVGNGISLIITIGILSSLPSTMGSIIRQLNLDSQEPGQLTFSSLVVLSGVFVLIIIGTILIIQGQRKIPLQYARRIVGRQEVQGGNAYIPLKINYAGVIPVIFATSLLMFPATIGQFVGQRILGRAICQYDLSWNLGIHDLLCVVNYFLHLFLDSDTVPSGTDRLRYEEKRSLCPWDPSRKAHSRFS